MKILFIDFKIPKLNNVYLNFIKKYENEQIIIINPLIFNIFNKGFSQNHNQDLFDL